MLTCFAAGAIPHALDAGIELGDPLMIACIAAPVGQLAGVSNCGICSTAIFVKVPESCRLRSHRGKRIVLAHFLIAALKAACA